jgi:hypothetical protein
MAGLPLGRENGIQAHEWQWRLSGRSSNYEPYLSTVRMHGLLHLALCQRSTCFALRLTMRGEQEGREGMSGPGAS